MYSDTYIQKHTVIQGNFKKLMERWDWRGMCFPWAFEVLLGVHICPNTHTHTLHFLSLSRVTWTAWDKVTGKSHGHKWVVSASQADCPHPSLGNSDLPLSSLYVFHKCGITGFPEGPHGQPLLGTWWQPKRCFLLGKEAWVTASVDSARHHQG